MPARISESIVLRSYPLKEADLIVSFLTRDLGKLRGVAKGARRPKSRFGAGLERLSQVRMFYFQRETRELVTLDACELVSSPLNLGSEYETAVALDFFAEASEQLLPPAEPSELHFRLLASVLEYLGSEAARERKDAVWPAVLYFSLWAVRIAGFLPQLRVSRESLAIAEEMMRLPIGQLSPRSWRKTTGADLRQFLVHRMEEQIERNLVTVPLLESL
ncbi:MAG: DNA repair protein RecO [Acidobacteriales bacterium]|nr:DNA repair protein RecO [Terriglobales bacterium]